MSRRILLVHFQNIPARVDTRLFDKLKEELPAIIYRCDHQHRRWTALLRTFTGKDILAHPKMGYFRDTDRVVTRLTSFMSDFLDSERVIIHSSAKMTVDQFNDAARQYCTSTNQPYHPISRDNFDAEMKMYRLVMDDQPTVRNGKLAKWIHGVGLPDEYPDLYKARMDARAMEQLEIEEFEAQQRGQEEERKEAHEEKEPAFRLGGGGGAGGAAGAGGEIDDVEEIS